MKTPIEYIKESWSIYTKKENFIFFARIMAVLVIVSTVLSYVFNYFYPVDTLDQIDYTNTPLLITLITFSILVFVINLWAQTTTYYAIFNVGSSEKEVFKLGYKNMWRFFIISLILGLIILFGIVLVIIPAVIFGIWYSFSTFLVLDKNMKVKESLATSKLMVKGKFWKILGRLVVFGVFSFLISVVLSIVPYAGSILISFIAPLFMLPYYLLYGDLSVSN